MIRFVLALLVAASLTAVGDRANAADAKAVVIAPASPVIAVEPEAPPPDAVVATRPLKPEPRVAYGCKRVWRCDAQVCEWRRGCWGIYGYMEGPYYSQELAKSQWERDGWPVPTGKTRKRAAVDPTLK